MYTRFFGFKERPFRLVPNPEYLFLGRSHEEALAHLTYAVNYGDGFVAVTGEVGTGKTTLCRVFLDGLDETVTAAYIFNPRLDGLHLLKAINDDLGIDSTPASGKALIDILNDFLLDQKSRGRRVLLLIDEAQNLSKEVLEQLRLLSNLETNRDKLLQIILVGQPELAATLASRELRQLSQRISISCHLTPFTRRETRQYIRHRANLALRRPATIFTRSAGRLIHNHAGGIPRLINIAADRALLGAFGLNRRRVNRTIARQAVRELSGTTAGNRPAAVSTAAGLVLLGAAALTVAGFIHYHPALAPPTEPPEPLLTINNTDSSTDPGRTGPTTAVAGQAPAATSPPEKPAPTGPTAPRPAALKPAPPTMPVATESAEIHPDTDAATGTPETIYSVHVGSFTTIEAARDLETELRKLGYPSFHYRDHLNGTQQFNVVAGKYAGYDLARRMGKRLSRQGYNNFLSRSTKTLGLGSLPVTIAELTAGRMAGRGIAGLLAGMDSFSSRRTAMNKVLSLWRSGAVNIGSNLEQTTDDRRFFALAARRNGMLLHRITAADPAMLRQLNLPAVLTFFLPARPEPLYLALIGREAGLFILAGDDRETEFLVDSAELLEYWSGEAYLPWKNFLGLDGTVALHASGDSVLALEKLLAEIGFDVTPDRVFDRDTMAAVKNIQARYGMTVDGLVGPLTKIALQNEIQELPLPWLVGPAIQEGRE